MTGGETIKKGRELHTDLALDAIDFSAYGKNKINHIPDRGLKNLVKCEFFDINILHLDKPIERDYSLLDSFVIYICTEGSFTLRWENNPETVSKGETILLPAMIMNVNLEPEPDATILEIYISN